MTHSFPTLRSSYLVLLALQHLKLRPEKPTQAVTLFGNGGGSSVLGTDILSSVGLDVSPFDPNTRERLEAMRLPPGTSVANPIDAPVRTLQEKDGWVRSEQHTSELQSPMRNSYAVFCLKKKKQHV